jgi:peptide/nickel transport system substrate-binding protein
MRKRYVHDNHGRHTNRRSFLRATAAGGLAGVTALAGCSQQSNQSDEETEAGGSNGSEETEAGGSNRSEETETSGSNGSEETETGGGQSAGEKLPKYVYYNNPPNYDSARHDGINLIAERMQELGLDVEVQVFEWGTLLDRVYNQTDYAIATWNQSLNDEPGVRLPEMFHSRNTDGGQGNWSGYSNSDLDPKLLEQLQLDGQERIDLLHEIQATIIDEVPMIPAVHSVDLITYNSNQVSGWVDTPTGYNDFENMITIEVSNENNELRGIWPEDIGSLNPLGPTASSYKTIFQFNVLYDRLVRLNGDYEPEPELSLATEWSRPDDSSVEYTIREGQQWHDGEDLTAEDVAFSINYLMDNEVANYSTQWELVDTVERNGNTVRVNFNETVGPVHSVFSNQLFIIPQHVWSEVDDPENANISEPVGSGPLQFDYWDTGSELSLRKYDGHWTSVNFDRRIWRIVPENSTVWGLLKQGDINYIPQTQVGKQLVDNEELDQIVVKSHTSDATWHVTPNNRLDGFDDPVVRQAIHNTIPKTPIVEQLLYGYGERGWNFVTSLFGQYSNEDVTRYEESMERARGRLEEAGYTWNDDGLLQFPSE